MAEAYIKLRPFSHACENGTKHQDDKHRQNYLTRTASMKGDWKTNKYSANNLSRAILW